MPRSPSLDSRPSTPAGAEPQQTFDRVDGYRQPAQPAAPHDVPGPLQVSLALVAPTPRGGEPTEADQGRPLVGNLPAPLCQAYRLAGTGTRALPVPGPQAQLGPQDQQAAQQPEGVHGPGPGDLLVHNPAHGVQLDQPVQHRRQR